MVVRLWGDTVSIDHNASPGEVYNTIQRFFRETAHIRTELRRRQKRTKASVVKREKWLYARRKRSRELRRAFARGYRHD